VFFVNLYENFFKIREKQKEPVFPARYVEERYLNFVSMFFFALSGLLYLWFIGSLNRSSNTGL